MIDLEDKLNNICSNDANLQPPSRFADEFFWSDLRNHMLISMKINEIDQIVLTYHFGINENIEVINPDDSQIYNMIKQVSTFNLVDELVDLTEKFASYDELSVKQ